MLFDEIISYRTNGKEVKQQDAYVTTSRGTKRRRESTVGWELLVKWKDNSTTSVALKDLKESYPVQVAEYAVEARISEEPAFAWWVPYTLQKRNRIIAKKLKSNYWVCTHKFGIKIPKTVAEARAFDLENGNTLWWDAICKEMRNVRPAFEAWDKDTSEMPIGYQEVKCNLIFDVKMGENFRRKARFVAGGHTTEVPSTLTYASVVSRDSVRITLTIAVLNDLQILACDIHNAYLTADCRKRSGPAQALVSSDRRSEPNSWLRRPCTASSRQVQLFLLCSQRRCMTLDTRRRRRIRTYGYVPRSRPMALNTKNSFCVTSMISCRYRQILPMHSKGCRRRSNLRTTRLRSQIYTSVLHSEGCR